MARTDTTGSVVELVAHPNPPPRQQILSRKTLAFLDKSRKLGQVKRRKETRHRRTKTEREEQRDREKKSEE